jgi:peptidoglycan/xylan/chitin deacetylase (PgdA/CDA1 family)
MRAPYGAVDAKVSAVAIELGLAIVQWNVDSQDTGDRDDQRDAQESRDNRDNRGKQAGQGRPGKQAVRAADGPSAVAHRVIDGVTRAGPRGGAIVVMHDVRRATVDAVPKVIAELGRLGYTFVTVPELFGSHPMRPGTTYYQGPALTVVTN